MENCARQCRFRTPVAVENELLNLWTGSEKTVLFVTHDLNEAVSLSDEVPRSTVHRRSRHHRRRWPVAAGVPAEGSVDVVSGYYDHTIQMQARQRDVTSFVTMLRYPSMVLAVSSKAGKPIAGEVRARIGGASSAVAAMEQGQVDAAVMTDPAFSLSYSTREWLNNNGENARKLASAIVKTLQWVGQHSTEKIADKMPPEYTQGNREVYVESIAKAKDAYSNDYLPGKAR